MDMLAFDAKKFVRLALRSIVVCFLVIVVSALMMVKPAQASGNVPPLLDYCLWSSLNPWVRPTCGFATADAACAVVGLPASANGGCPGGYYYWTVTSTLSCPANSTGTPEINPAYCTCNSPTAADPVNYVPDAAGTNCVAAVCPVADPLKPLDPAVQPYEDGLVDMGNETQATREGAACIVREARARHLHPQIVSGYRPPAYQTHLREVYDKWQLLKDNNDSVCADTKRQVEIEFMKHSPFAHQPGNTSRHSTGRAVDIHLSDYTDADTIAAGCSMSRPVANDRSHFVSPR
jgi:hypothetical protein